MDSPRPSRSVSSASLPTRRDTPVPELSAAEKEKSTLISAACESDDIAALVDLATSTSGLVSDSLRRNAWPLLLGCKNNHDLSASDAWKELPAHRDENQVALDVNRAFVYYPRNESEKQLDRRKEELSDVITSVLRAHPTLCYFQGYHDIVQVFLLVLGSSAAAPAVARLSLLRIRDFMLSSIDAALSQLELLGPIFQTADPELYAHLPKRQPSFAIAHTITLFAHNIQEYRDIARVFDFFLAREAVMPIYFFVAVALSRREELLAIEEEDEAIMHVMLGKLPQPFDVEFHIARALELYERIPPESLRSWAWWRISTSSVLKCPTTPHGLRDVSLADGERLLEQQEKELRRKQALNRALMNAKQIRRRLWVYRRHGFFSLAIAMGVYAVWLGKTGNIGTRYVLFEPFGSFIQKIVGALRF